MSVFIKEYIIGCVICQNTKNITYPIYAPLIPNEIPERPWQVVTMDFITDLLQVGPYNTIHIIVDRSTKGVVYTP